MTEPMTFSLNAKRIFLSLMTAFVVFVLGSELLSSLQASQIQDRLELNQTQLVLQTQEWRSPQENDLTQALKVGLLGSDAVGEALKKYENLSILQDIPPNSEIKDPLAWSATEIDRLRLERGLLEMLQGNPDEINKREKAFEQWTIVAEGGGELKAAAIVLRELWQDTPRILPDSEMILKTQLQGWFEYRSLERLYQIQQRSDALDALDESEQAVIQLILRKLLILTGLPLGGMVLGVGILVILLIRGGIHTWQDRSLTRSEKTIAQGDRGLPQAVWAVPWTADVTWQGMVIGFFLIGQILVVRLLFPLGALGLQSIVGSNTFQSVKVQALLVVGIYGSMAIAVFAFLYYTLRPFFPLPQDWFQCRVTWQGIGWGIAGYLMALPLVTIVSVLNQQLWQGQGGSNPMLFLALKNNDRFALACFFFTAAIAAPFFEEWIFRGFLMASFTRYFSPAVSILSSGLIFALAHLSLSEILPLWVLGSVLGYVYGRSKNLITPIVLHGLWNSGTLLGLTLLGGNFGPG